MFFFLEQVLEKGRGKARGPVASEQKRQKLLDE